MKFRLIEYQLKRNHLWHDLSRPKVSQCHICQVSIKLSRYSRFLRLLGKLFFQSVNEIFNSSSNKILHSSGIKKLGPSTAGLQKSNLFRPQHCPKSMDHYSKNLDFSSSKVGSSKISSEHYFMQTTSCCLKAFYQRDILPFSLLTQKKSFLGFLLFFSVF